MGESKVQNKGKLRNGYTTGTCAAIAAKASARMLFTKNIIEKEKVITPKGIEVCAKIYHADIKHKMVSCGVKKDAGDDPDVTNGVIVYAKVELLDSTEILIDGGIGIGRVTKPGLQQRIGEAAINKVPRQMIENEVTKVFSDFGYEGGAKVIISIPEGVGIAQKTFNPRLGIEGGISVLGTSGIVEPMSEQALIDTIFVEMKVKKANGADYLIVTPGNYGTDFIKEYMKMDLEQAVKCSNFIGEAIDFAMELNLKGILLVGHAGKFIKLAAGIMNTHSKQADGRMDIITANAALEGAPVMILKKLMACVSTDEAMEILKEMGIMERTMQRITDRIEYYVTQRARGELQTGVVFFSNIHGILGKTSQVDWLLRRF